ncbi:MAG: shikimate dehydrogenase [Microbacterium sp.]
MPPTARERRLEVWGDPIAHSLSPQLHAAAYAALGLPWEYGRRRVPAADFDAELAGLDASYRGLSLTYPLKAAAFAAAARRDRHAELTGAVNTLVLDAQAGVLGLNTDVGGLVRDLGEHGVAGLEAARIVGAGATATSAVVALAELGAHRIEVVARRPEAVAPLHRVGERLGVVVVAVPFDAAHGPVPLTLATLPGGVDLPDTAARSLAAGGGLLYDVVYGHWPTRLADAWQRAGGRAVNGLGMLLHQATLQVRAFRGDVGDPLPGEAAVVAAMRAALA